MEEVVARLRQAREEKEEQKKKIQDLGALRSQGGLVRSYKAPKKKQKHRKPAADRFDSQPSAPGLLLAVLVATPYLKQKHNPKKAGGTYEVPQEKRWFTYREPVQTLCFANARRNIIIITKIRRDGRGRVIERSGRSSSKIKKSSRRKNRNRRRK